MKRRGVLAMLGALFLGGAPGTRAQPAPKVRSIGSLGVGAAPNSADIQRVWATAPALGWIEGQNLIVERRYAAGKAALLRPYAEELVRLNVEVIVTIGTAATIAAKNATTRIPIVMLSAGDPVRTGLVASLAKPGGNVTGYSIISTELDAKRLGLLRELLPSARRVGVLVNPATAHFGSAREDSERPYRSLGIEPIVIPVASASELENAVAEVARRRAQALFVPTDGLFYENRILLVRAALRYALPTIVGDSDILEAGGLLCLSIDDTEANRVFVYFVDRILKGAKPADLPVQQPTKFVLSINLKTAKLLGLTIPQPLLLRADVVIQ